MTCRPRATPGRAQAAWRRGPRVTDRRSTAIFWQGGLKGLRPSELTYSLRRRHGRGSRRVIVTEVRRPHTRSQMNGAWR